METMKHATLFPYDLKLYLIKSEKINLQMIEFSLERISSSKNKDLERMINREKQNNFVGC
jgi:hypothetical protein